MKEKMLFYTLNMIIQSLPAARTWLFQVFKHRLNFSIITEHNEFVQTPDVWILLLKSEDCHSIIKSIIKTVLHQYYAGILGIFILFFIQVSRLV